MSLVSERIFLVQNQKQLRYEFKQINLKKKQKKKKANIKNYRHSSIRGTINDTRGSVITNQLNNKF